MANPFAAVLGRQLRTSAGKADSRKKLIGAVRAAAARMQLGDDDRRAIQLEETGKPSMADMTPAEIGKVLDRLNRDRPAPMAHRGHVAKIRALWWTLYWIGTIDHPTDAAIDTFVQRQTGIASLRFLDHRSAPAVIEALKAWAGRDGVVWPVAGRTAKLVVVDELAGATGGKVIVPPSPALAERIAVMEAIWRKLVDRRLVVGGSPTGYVAQALALGTDRAAWTATDLDQAIKLLGKRLRRAMAKDAG